MEDIIIASYFSPLLFKEAEDFLNANKEPPNYEDIIKYFCRPEEDSSIDSILKRYSEIREVAKSLFAVPVEDKILFKLIWPLKHAIVSYTVGNYLGTIALCGLVAEMATMLLFEISPIQINNRPLGEDEGKEIFGNTFERLGQKRRIDVLHGYNIITDDQAKSLHSIRETRNPYLHRFTQDHTKLSSEAKDAFHATVSFIVEVIGQGIDSQGRIILNPKILSYLSQRGLLESPDQGQTESDDDDEFDD